jgi:N-acetylglutamate synthase
MVSSEGQGDDPGITWPAEGTRVVIRYRRPAGSMPPLTDVIGYLTEIDPIVRVRTKSGEVVEIAPADVVIVKAVGEQPVRKQGGRHG